MADSNEKAYELNEVSWWSNWTEAKWLSQNAYLLFSEEFDEYFFNRGGFLNITSESIGFIEPMEREFETRKKKPHLFLQSDQLGSKLLLVLQQRGYRIADQMAVMEIDDASFRVNPELKIEQVAHDDGRLEAWSRVYLDSFYGGLDQVRAVTAVARKLVKDKGTSLLLGTMNGEPAGVAALFRTGKVCGVYCVGTHRDWRKKHIATTMLEFSHRSAVKEGRRLILQTILSDSAEGLYLKLGFKRAYLKDLFVMDLGRVPG